VPGAQEGHSCGPRGCAPGTAAATRGALALRSGDEVIAVGPALRAGPSRHSGRPEASTVTTPPRPTRDSAGQPRHAPASCRRTPGGGRGPYSRRPGQRADGRKVYVAAAQSAVRAREGTAGRLPGAAVRAVRSPRDAPGERPRQPPPPVRRRRVHARPACGAGAVRQGDPASPGPAAVNAVCLAGVWVVLRRWGRLRVSGVAALGRLRRWWLVRPMLVVADSYAVAGMEGRTASSMPLTVRGYCALRHRGCPSGTESRPHGP
jgi:hypothetical protein